MQIFSTLGSATSISAFPSFCALLVGGSSLLQNPLSLLQNCIIRRAPGPQYASDSALLTRRRVSRFLAALISAWLSLRTLNRPRVRPSKHPSSALQKPQKEEHRTDNLGNSLAASSAPVEHRSVSAGDTIDLTLFVATRAFEASTISAWRYHRRTRNQQVRATSRIASNFANSFVHNIDSLVFAISSGAIMWAWFYHPTRLPITYNKWISSAAEVDPRLIEMLRRARDGDFVYGKDKGPPGRLLQGMCQDYGWPLAWGDGEKTCPIPCDVVHMGVGPSCHKHACVRFVRAFRFAIMTNLPLQLAARLIPFLLPYISRNPSQIPNTNTAPRHSLTPQSLQRVLKSAFISSTRSSAFLAAFVSLMYYGICLSRTLVGPRLFSTNTISRQAWDSGLCVRVACVLCGWSILIEDPKRRGELAMFVAPRGLTASGLVKRRYKWEVSCHTDHFLSLLLRYLFSRPLYAGPVFRRHHDYSYPPLPPFCPFSSLS